MKETIPPKTQNDNCRLFWTQMCFVCFTVVAWPTPPTQLLGVPQKWKGNFQQTEGYFHKTFSVKNQKKLPATLLLVLYLASSPNFSYHVSERGQWASLKHQPPLPRMAVPMLLLLHHEPLAPFTTEKWLLINCISINPFWESDIPCVYQACIAKR